MSVTAVTTKAYFEGNDVTTEFSAAFGAVSDDHIVVVHKDDEGNLTTLTQDTDYTIDSLTRNAITLTYPKTGDPLATGEELWVYRETPQTQTADLRNYGNHDAEAREIMFDQLCMEVQELQEQLDRAVLTPITGGDAEDALTQTEADARYLKLTGGTVTGAISYAADPTEDDHLTRKSYVLAKAGGTITGPISYAADPTEDNHLTRKSYIHDTFLALAGGTMSGGIDMGGSALHNLPTQNSSTGDNHAASCAYLRTKKADVTAAETGLTQNTWTECARLTLTVPSGDPVVCMCTVTVRNPAQYGIRVQRDPDGTPVTVASKNPILVHTISYSDFVAFTCIDSGISGSQTYALEIYSNQEGTYVSDRALVALCVTS